MPHGKHRQAPPACNLMAAYYFRTLPVFLITPYLSPYHCQYPSKLKHVLMNCSGVYQIANTPSKCPQHGCCTPAGSLEHGCCAPSIFARDGYSVDQRAWQRKLENQSTINIILDNQKVLLTKAEDCFEARFECQYKGFQEQAHNSNQ